MEDQHSDIIAVEFQSAHRYEDTTIGVRWNQGKDVLTKYLSGVDCDSPGEREISENEARSLIIDSIKHGAIASTEQLKPEDIPGELSERLGFDPRKIELPTI